MPKQRGRIKLSVPVAVLVEQNCGTRILPAQTVDASVYGARLKDLPGELSIGQIVTLVYREKQCAFRVAWIGIPGSAWEHHVGLECQDVSGDFWGFEYQDSSIFSLDALIFPWEYSEPLRD